MQTLQPVLRRGRSVWNQVTFPSDEFQERVRGVRGMLSDGGMRALLVVGGGERYQDIAYLTNLVPLMPWTVVVLPVEGEPAIIAGIGGGREIPFVRTCTWVADVRVAPSLGVGMAQILRERGIEAGRVAVAGFEEHLPVALYDEVVGHLSGYELVAIDDRLAAIRRRKRARELGAMAEAGRIAQLAGLAAVQAFGRGGSNAEAVVAAERAARTAGAHDVRVLCNLEVADALWPYEAPSTVRNVPLCAYIAVEYEGYWADRAFTSPAVGSEHYRRACSGLAAMREAAREGARVADVAGAALREIGDEHRQMALAYGLGGGIGLSLDEAPRIDPESDELLEASMTLSLRLCLGRPGEPPVLVSDLVRVGQGPASSLLTPV
ncbi:MAG TPA: M24 family metallopeptidase [Candidatus Dormibacteraeota bacterium]|nr:M24 family metallopeptidase [Candidatus Dormibacteraeota bacterium]